MVVQCVSGFQALLDQNINYMLLCVHEVVLTWMLVFIKKGIGLMISTTLLANGATVYIIGPEQAKLDK